LETLPKVRVLDAVEVLFESEVLPHKQIVVVFVKESGRPVSWGDWIKIKRKIS